MTLYSSEAVENLAKRYVEKNGDIHVIDEGSLLEYGLAIFTGENLKTAIIKERYLNEWSSAYTVKMYNKIPWKYEKMIMQACDGEHNTIDEIVSCKSCDQVLR